MDMDMKNEIGYALTNVLYRDYPGNRYANCPSSILSPVIVIAIITACLGYGPNLDITTYSYLYANLRLTLFHNYSQRPCPRSSYFSFAR